jgi:predicted hotdog family 3-hydroxylacyl-ACP dehydratase
VANKKGPEFVPQFIPTDRLIDLVPHKGKMFLLSRVIQYDIKERSVTTEYDITKDCIFYEESLGGIPNWSGFEIMAQGISTFGSIERTINGTMDQARPGVILSVVNLKSNVGVLKVNSTITMKIKEDYHMDDVTRYNCRLFADKKDEEPAVSATITVMEMNDISAFFADGQNHQQ